MLGAPTGAWAARVAEIDSRKDAAPHGRARKSKLNAVCISSGRRYAVKRSMSGTQISPTSTRGAGVRVGDRAPRAVDVVQLVAVFGGVRPGLLLADLGQVGVLDQQRRGVDAHARDAAVEPEPQDVLVLAAHVGVVPVQVGLLGREHVQVPLAGRAVGVGRARPGRRPGSSRPSAWGSRRRPRPCRGGTRSARARGCPGLRRAPPGTTDAGR